MTDIHVRGTADPTTIAVVVAVLGRRRTDVPASANTPVSAWQQIRRDALARRAALRPRSETGR